MKAFKNKIMAIVMVMVALFMNACRQQESHYEHIEPARVEHIEGSELSKLALTEKAMERIGIQTAPAAEEMIAHSEPALRLVVPYSALIYDPEARLWVYTNPEPRTFIRHEVKVDFIVGDKAVLLEGPPAGTEVVTRGAAELYGTEYNVGH
ncbi:MAG: hypothetical protein H6560_22270 [Lewinellaceae bacterium]|nr:hypothetical protein [Lewinellaceae bacterium]